MILKMIKPSKFSSNLYNWSRLRTLQKENYRALRISAFKPTEGDILELERTVPRTLAEFKNQKNLKLPESPPNARSINVSILGTPNAGKSTLTNQLLGWRVCSVSKKVHTTRYMASAILTIDNSQIVFLDTPGLVSFEKSRKHHLNPSLLWDPMNSLNHADLIAVVVDASNKWTRYSLDNKLIELLEKHRVKKSILVLNKCDTIRDKTILLDLARRLSNGAIEYKEQGFLGKVEVLKPISVTKEQILKEYKKKLSQDEVYVPDKKPDGCFEGFSRVFMLSALEGEGTEDLLEYIKDSTVLRSWKYHPSMVTDQNPQDLAILTVREKLLDDLPQEIPYVLDITIQVWEIDPNGILIVVMKVKCKKEQLVKKVIGPKGSRIAAIVKSAQQELTNMFRCEVYLKILVQK